jgi:enolase
MNGRIASIEAMEILDSRGNPTLRVFVELRGGARASASVAVRRVNRRKRST